MPWCSGSNPLRRPLLFLTLTKTIMILPRDKAQVLVNSITFKVKQFKAVSKEDCRRLLGERYQLLVQDRIRNLGPDKDTIYPWNLVDYLSNENPSKGKS